jgi:hypothetical protein
MLGHSKPSVPLDIYAHVYSGRQEQASALMDELVPPVAVDFSPESFEKTKSNVENPVAHEKRSLPIWQALTPAGGGRRI